MGLEPAASIPKLLSARYDGPPKADTLQAELLYIKPPADQNRKGG